MNLIRTGKFSFTIGIVLFLSMLFCKFNSIKDRSPDQPFTIAWDVYGYYMHLPNTFIYGDVGMKDMKRVEEINSKYHTTPYLYQAADGIDGKKVNVYPIGMAIAYAPGFFVAHAYAKMTGYPADGYSPPYQWSLFISGFIFTLIGIFMSRKILLLFFTDGITALIMALMMFGTNYFYQVGMDIVMPHNFLFALSACIIWFTIKWHATLKIKYAIILGLLIGWATVARPTELLWILIPILWGIKNKDDLKTRIKLFTSNFKQVLAFGISLVLVGLPQLMYWKYTSGHWLSYNHGESFSFLQPYTLEFLFSYKKGWLLYTPLMIFALLGLVSLYRNKRELFYVTFIFTVLNVYILSSWECWWYAASYSQRPIVESYSLLLLPFGYFINGISLRKTFAKYSILSILSILLLLNIFQTWQFCHGVIDAERMTRTYYWKVFGKTEPPAGAGQYLEVDRHFDGEEKFRGEEQDFYSLQLMNEGYEGKVPDNKMKNVCDTFSYQGKRSFRLDKDMGFTPEFSEEYRSLNSKYYMWVRVSAWVYPVTSPDSENFALVIDMNKKGQAYKYQAYEAKKLKIEPRKWNKISVDYLTPEIWHGTDHLEIYFWNMGKGTVFVDSMNTVALIPKNTY